MPPQEVRLTDAESGASARVLAGFGFNCFECRLATPAGLVDVIWAETNFSSGEARASGSGIPILFPFPGRLRGSTFLWDGDEYQLEAGDGRGNAIHGFVLNRPWRIIEQNDRRVVGQFRASQDAPETLRQWPADFQITVSYELSAHSLDSELKVENPDRKPLPFGLGTHPYFRIPLTGGDAEQCLLQLPATHQWELRDMLPTGQQLASNTSARGTALQNAQFDNVFTGLAFNDERCVTAVEDPAGGLRLVQEFSDGFSECVIYTPPHREAICIEPYTCVPGAHGLTDFPAGLQVLEPGGAFNASVSIRLESS